MKIKTETELSPIVRKYWEDRGYCVHGEVAVFNSSLFIDHVAHTGPCSCPEHVVSIEMKKGAGKNLRTQLRTLDKKHVSHEIWGAVFTSPREATVTAWEGYGIWLRPGLLVFDEDSGKLVEIMKCEEVSEYKRQIRSNKLLLVEENRSIIAGYTSADQQYQYVTHWKRIRSAAKEFALSTPEPFILDDIYDLGLPEYDLYRKPKAAIRSALKELIEQDRVLRQIGKENGQALYQRLDAEKDELIDERFLDMFDI